ncbi:MAG TPA: peptide chain release factor N(5)-glutamine methyltransferase [Pyrinomonadaceae bacterium]|nr:peptide chain release factor N(5)-glutamine methyltransferase [Pyrinomonadaceae bacterium]
MNISVGNAVSEGAQVLREAGIAEARRESGSLLAHAIGRDQTFVITHASDSLAIEVLATFRTLVTRRAAGEPLQYITGHQEFFKLDFEVTSDVLIPRPETELIVEIALELLKGDPDPFIADIGAGSGCIAISLLYELSDARAIATDISPAAHRIAQRNADRHGVGNRLTLIESDCFSALDPKKPFSLIVSNPPYIRDDDLKTLQREVGYEPRAALAGGPDGLDIIRRLLREAAPFLRPGGHFVFEIGFGQSTLVEQLINPDVWELTEMRPDLQGIARAVVLRKT